MTTAAPGAPGDRQFLVHVPPKDRPVIPELLKAYAARQTEFVKAFRTAGEHLLAEKLAEEIAPKLALSQATAGRIVDLLTGLYVSLDRSPRQFPFFLNAVIGAMRESAGDAPPLDWSSFERDLGDVLKSPSIAMAAKALDLKVATERSFCSARIYSDIRPIFKPDVSERISSAVLIHNLELSFHENDEVKSLFVAMDRSDLSTLQEVIQRAIFKEENLRENLKLAGIALVEKE